MKLSPLYISVVFMGLVGTTVDLQAAGAPIRESVTLPYDVMDPSVHVARTYQKHGDYETAVLLYDAVLERNPSDQQALKSLVQCYKALEDEGQDNSASIGKTPEKADDNLSDLPNLIPNDSTNAQDPSQKPTRPLL